MAEISEKEPRIEVFTRQDDKTWLYHIASELEANIILHSINHTISLRDIYQKVGFEATSQ